MTATQSVRTAADGYNWFQRRLKGIEAGDTFAIPLPIGGYGFGRVINADEREMLAEFFRYWKTTQEFEPKILTAGRLFPPTGFFVSDIEWWNRKRPWRVIHKDPEFYPNDLYELKFSQCGDGENRTCFTLHDHRKTVAHVSLDDVNEWRVTSRLPQHPNQITDVVERKLREVGIVPDGA